jgi:hypothetical protein
MAQTPLSLQPHEILMVKAVEPWHVVVDIRRCSTGHGCCRTPLPHQRRPPSRETS